VLTEKGGKGSGAEPSLGLQAKRPVRGIEVRPYTAKREREVRMGESGQDKAKGSANGKATAGRAMLWVGAVVLWGEVWMLLTQLSEFWQGSGAASLGWIAALGAAAQKAASFLVWNDGLLLTVAAKVLVLCCPLLIIAVGIGLIRTAELAHAQEFAAKGTQAEEERL